MLNAFLTCTEKKIQMLIKIFFMYLTVHLYFRIPVFEWVVSTCCICIIRKDPFWFLLGVKGILFQSCSRVDWGCVEGTLGREMWSASSLFCCVNSLAICSIWSLGQGQAQAPSWRVSLSCMDKPSPACQLSAWCQGLWLQLFPASQQWTLSICVLPDFVAPFDHSLLPETLSSFGF